MNKNLEKIIASIYLVSLPLSVPEFITDRTQIITSISDIVLVIGLLLAILNIFTKGIILRKNMLYTTMLIGFCVFMSLLLSLIYHDKFGTINGEDTYSAILGSTLFWILKLLMIFYWYYIWEKKIFNKQTVFKCLNIIIVYQLIVGYAQLAIINGSSIITRIYDLLNVGQILASSSFVMGMGRVPLTGSEPAVVGTIAGMIIFPYLCSRILLEKHFRKHLLTLIAFLPLIYMTKSASVYMIILGIFIVISIYYIKNLLKGRIKPLTAFTILFLALFCILSFLFIGTNSIDTFKYTIQYNLVDKVLSQSNQSTTHRVSTLINAYNVFIRYPIFGIGDGNQGFYFTTEYLPSWVFQNPKTIEMANGAYGVVSGGAVIPAYISGYGIVGSIFLLIWIRRCLRSVKQWKEKLGEFYFIYYIGIFAVLIAGIQSSLSGIAMFIVSIPIWIESYNSRAS